MTISRVQQPVGSPSGASSTAAEVLADTDLPAGAPGRTEP